MSSIRILTVLSIAFICSALTSDFT